MNQFKDKVVIITGAGRSVLSDGRCSSIGHFGDSEKEIGRVCLQLASPDFKYMTGETITLEGGLGLRP